MISFARSRHARHALALLSFLALAPAACASHVDDDGTSDEESELRRRKKSDGGSDAVAPAPSPSVIDGWTLGEKVAAKGVGTTTHNSQPTWKCKTYTVNQLPCGGWVSLEVASDGHVRANVGAMGHGDFYDYVSGTSASNSSPPFPPYASNPFWNALGSADLDAEGRGHIELVQRDQWNQVSRHASADVQVDHGAAVVTYASELRPGSCNHYAETCTFQVLGH